MCTVTAERRPEGWRITMNRDELKTRSQGEVPGRWGSPEILAPRDPDAGGTWIGVRRDGTWACLLNGYQDGPQAPKIAAPQTRGRIIPLVLGADDGLHALQQTDLSSTNSFRLWLGTDQGITDCFWDGTMLTTQEVAAKPFAFVTSSSLRQDDIKKARRKAFEHWADAGAPHATNGLPRLHVDRAGLAPEEAILMERDYAHTKSCTQIITTKGTIRMQHWLALGPEKPPHTVIELDR